MNIFVYILLFVVGALLLRWAVLWLAKRNLLRKGRYLEEEISALAGFDAGGALIDQNGRAAIAIDEEGGQMAFAVRRAKGVVEVEVVAWRDVLSSEVVEDNGTVTATVRLSQLRSALAGALLLGTAGALIGGVEWRNALAVIGFFPGDISLILDSFILNPEGAVISALALGAVGMIIGSLTGKTKSFGNVSGVALVVVVNRTENPLYRINLMKSMPLGKTNRHYVRAINRARRWHGVMQVVMNRANEQIRQAKYKRR